jgi:hypothetical protein
MEWMVLEYLNHPEHLRFYTKSGSFNPKHYIKVGEADTREEAVRIVWELDPERSILKDK